MADYKYFKVNIIDLTDEMLNASVTTNVYDLKRSADGKVALVKFLASSIPASMLRRGYQPVDKDVLLTEIAAGDWSETNPIINNSSPRDSDGSPMQRIKITSSGWHLQLHGVEFMTSQLDSVTSKKANGTEFGFTAIKCYNAEGTLLTTQEQCDTDAVTTIIDWEPTYDYEIIGGFFKQAVIPASDVRMWVIGVPDVPAVMGGSKEFVSNVNLKFLGLEDGFRADGRSPKYMTYNATYHTSKLRLLMRHSAGFKHQVHFIFEKFKA